MCISVDLPEPDGPMIGGELAAREVDRRRRAARRTAASPSPYTRVTSRAATAMPRVVSLTAGATAVGLSSCICSGSSRVRVRSLYAVQRSQGRQAGAGSDPHRTGYG